MTSGMTKREAAVSNEAADILANMKEDALEETPLAQAFTDDYAHLALSTVQDRAITTVLVTSRRELHNVPTKDFEVPGTNLVVRDDPKEYARLVKRKWSKASLEDFLSGAFKADPQATYQQIKNALDNLIDLTGDPVYADVVSCWIIATYFYRLFDAFPYLGVLGPKGSGKTKLASLIEELAFNPMRADSITTAQIFRIVQVTGGTLILDEQESLSGGFTKDDRLNLLRGGYKRGGKAIRSKETQGGFTTEEFDTYSPKVLINTSGIEELLADRCIAVHMLRSTQAQGKAMVKDWKEKFAAIRDELYGLALGKFTEVEKAYHDPEFASGLNNRQRERWIPILAVATVVCPAQMPALLSIAAQDTDSALLTDPTDTAFLYVMDSLVGIKPTVNLTTVSIGESLESALGDDDIKAAKVGKLVRKYFGKIGKRSGASGSIVYTITRAMVDDVLKRYPITEGTEGSEGSMEEGVGN